MPVERSAGAVIFRKEHGENLYLLLQYQGISHRTNNDYWDLPKGHIEKGETVEDTVLREVEEETGLKDIEIFSKFKETIKYFFRWEDKNILKFVTFFIAKTSTEGVIISSEHIGFQWLPYEAALKQLTFRNAKEILKKANNFLEKNASGS